MIQFRCPECRVKLAVTPDLIKKQITCPKCQGKVNVPEKSEEFPKPAPKVSALKTSPPLARVAATKSAALDEVEELEAADEIDEVDEIDESPSRKKKKAASRRDEDDDADEDSIDEDFNRKKKKKKKKKESGAPVMLIAGIGGGGALLLVIGLLVYFLGFRSTTVAKIPIAPPPPPPAPVVLPVIIAPRLPVDPIQADDPILKQKPPENITDETMKKTKKSTVFIKVTDANNQTSSGSGFFALQPGLIITNAHVVGMRRLNSPPKSVVIHIHSGEANEVASPAAVLGVDQENDLAILRVTNPPANLPDPIIVEQTLDLSELQNVYIFGFPLGEAIGKSITVAPSTVSSIRKNMNGEIEQVQVNGGMQPGNSGGPVVDSRGVVIGVAVSGFAGTQINFAVPSEKIRNLVEGRIREIGFGEPFRLNGVVKMNARLLVQDPLKRLQSYALDVWQGPKNKMRPPTRSLPLEFDGDQPKQTFPIQIDALGRGQIDFPLPAAAGGDTLLWVQPKMIDATGRPRWAGAVPLELASQAPLDRLEANLKLILNESTRTVEIVEKQSLELFAQKQRLELTRELEVDALETLVPNPKGASETFNVGRFEIKESKGFQSLPPAKLQQANAELTKLLATYPFKYALTPTGKATRAKVAGAGRYAPDARVLLDDMSTTFELTFVSLSDKLTQPNEQWNASSVLVLNLGENRRQTALVNMTCTYEGIRDKDANPQAFIRLDGVLDGGKRTGGLSGKISGHVLFDLKQGFISKLHFRIASEFETDDIQAIESTTILLSRAVGNTKNIVPSKSQSENVAKGKILLEKEATLVESDPIDKVRNKGAHHHVYELDLEKGKTYIIEMHAGENDKRDPKEGPFDPYLRLENPRGLQVAFDDDSGGGLDARIIYKASIDGKYKIHATTLPENQTGEYTLTVTEYDPNAANAPITPPNAPPVMKKKGPQKKF